MMKSCNECAYAILDDFGYSNYTVEGTTFHCGLKLHPDDGFDRFYGEEVRLKFAEGCEGYKEGHGAEIDVDREGVKYDAPTIEEKWSVYVTNDVTAEMLEGI